MTDATDRDESITQESGNEAELEKLAESLGQGD